MTKLAIVRLVLAAATLSGSITPMFAQEGIQGRLPWDWQDRNGASIAAMIEQKKGGLFEAGKGSGNGGGGCGGSAGNSTAIQNYTCIIVTNSTALIEGSQTGVGNQTATTATNGAANSAPNNMSTVLQSLIGNKH